VGGGVEIKYFGGKNTDDVVNVAGGSPWVAQGREEDLLKKSLQIQGKEPKVKSKKTCQIGHKHGLYRGVLLSKKEAPEKGWGGDRIAAGGEALKNVGKNRGREQEQYKRKT